jgi:hypothetical protein
MDHDGGPADNATTSVHPENQNETVGIAETLLGEEVGSQFSLQTLAREVSLKTPETFVS